VNDLLGQLLYQQFLGMNEHYSHGLTPRAFGKKRATKKDLKRNFQEILSFLTGGYKLLRLSALKLTDKKLKKTYVSTCDATIKHIKFMSREVKKRL